MLLYNIKTPSNYKFGYFFTFVFILLSIYFFIAQLNFYSIFSLCISFSFLIITIINANLLLPLNRLWIGLGLVLGAIINPIIMGFIFFGLFTPISILMRFFGRDELLIRQKDKTSYWKDCNDERSKNLNFTYQF